MMTGAFPAAVNVRFLACHAEVVFEIGPREDGDGGVGADAADGRRDVAERRGGAPVVGVVAGKSDVRLEDGRGDDLDGADVVEDDAVAVGVGGTGDVALVADDACEAGGHAVKGGAAGEGAVGGGGAAVVRKGGQHGVGGRDVGGHEGEQGRVLADDAVPVGVVGLGVGDVGLRGRGGVGEMMLP